MAALALFPELDLWTAAALATILAPTDAALGLPVVSNRRLPSRIRQSLNVESGLNDGICVPLLIIFLTLAEAERGHADIDPLQVVAEEIGFGTLGGVAAGVLGAWVLRYFVGRGWMSTQWQQINAFATPLLAYTTAVALGGSGFIAAFAAGIVYGVVARALAEPTTAFAEETGELLVSVTVTLSVFAHGVTAWPGANRHADWYDARFDHHPSMPESQPTVETRARGRRDSPPPVAMSS